MYNLCGKDLKNTKGITLISLVITIIVLIILASVSIGLLYGGSGLITKAQKAKKDYEEATKKEESMLAGIFEKNYVTYNGQLSVENGKLLNQYSDQIILKGPSAGNGKGIESLDEKYFNKDSLSSIKQWGANVFRIAVDTSEHYKGYIYDQEILDRACEIADICIELDMYVVIDWHVLYEENPNVYVEESKEFFSKIAERYKNSPNIIYEICNEPNGDETTWEEIKKYANQVIPVIREINEDAIILVGVPNWSHNIDDVIGDELQYDNIMYVDHLYPAGLTSDRFDRLKNAIENGIPVFISEWGLGDNQGEIYTEYASIIANYMKENKLSWCYWSMDDYNSSFAIVKKDEWNNELNDEILSESGKYLKNLLSDTQINNYPVLMSYSENYAFWNENYKSKITSIVIENSIDNTKINSSEKHWDVSINRNNSVIAYLQKDNENPEKYVLYIAAEGGVLANTDCRSLFKNFTSLKNIDINYFDTSKVTDMGEMFYNDENLENIDLTNFKTDNVKYMENLFYNCSSLKSLDLSNINFSKTIRTYGLFEYCKSLETIKFPSTTFKVISLTTWFAYCDNITEIDLSNADTKNCTSMQYAFNMCTNLKKIKVGENFNTSNVTNMDNMFFNCKNLEEFDFSKLDTSKVTTMWRTFGYCSKLKSLDLQGFDTSKVIKMDNLFQDCTNLEEIDLRYATFDNANGSYNDIFLNANNIKKIIVKDEKSKLFIQNKLDEAGIQANIEIL